MKLYRLNMYFIAFASLNIARADIAPKFVEEMRLAEEKVNDPTYARTNTTNSEPAKTRFAEFAELVDRSYEILEKEKDQLLKLDSKSKSLEFRMDTFVLVGALSLQLDPGDSAGELLLEIHNKHTQIFQNSVSKLEKPLREKLIKTLKIEKRVGEKGNGS